MNDWWDYIAHAQKAQEREEHKYIARVEVGTRRGRVLYRYFYTMDQYKRYLAGKEKGVKSELEKRQSPLYNLKRVGRQFIALLADQNEANNGSTYTDRNSARKRLTYDKALLKAAGKDFVDSVLDKLNVPVKDEEGLKEEKNTGEKKHLYIKRVTMPDGKYRYFYTQTAYEKYLQRVQYQANEPDFMKDVPKIDRYADESNEQAQADINEEYSEYSFARSHNCIFCSNAYELRQRGYNVQAADSKQDRTDKKYQQYDYSASNWYENPDYELIKKGGETQNLNKLMAYYNDDNGITKTIKNLDKDTNAQREAYNSYRSYTADDLRKAILSKNPPNSRGMLNVTWEGGKAGHSIVYEVDKHGNVIFRDTQVNEYYTADFLAQNIWSARFIRTDNLKLKPDILYTVEAN